MAYPDKGSVGLATRNSGGLVRFGVTAAAASAVLYTAVVLFGVNEASPSDVGVDGDRDTSVVHIRPHDSAASGARQKLPQASPAPARHRPQATTSVTKTLATAPRPRASRPTETSAPMPLATAPRPVAEATAPKAGVTPPTSPMAPAAPSPVTLPSITVPSVTVPSVTVQLPLPPQTLSAAPQLPGVSDLPG